MIIREKQIAFYLNVMNVSGLLRSGRGVYFLTSITFKRLRYSTETWQINAQYIDVLCVKL